MCTIIARFIAIAIFYYPLCKLGYGLDWKKYVVLSYGGLRGSHSLILALVLDNEAYPEIMRDKVVVYMGGVTILSLLIQAPTFNWVLDSVKLIKEKTVTKQLRAQFEQKLMVNYTEMVESLKQKKEFLYCDWKEVHKLLEVDNKVNKL